MVPESQTRPLIGNDGDAKVCGRDRDDDGWGKDAHRNDSIEVLHALHMGEGVCLKGSRRSDHMAGVDK